MKKMMFSILHWYFLIMIGGFGLLEVAAEPIDDREVISEGVGAIVAGNQAKARDEAIRDAMRKAVEQAVGIFISSDTVVENFQLISDRIFTKTSGYIKSYQVIGEEVEGDLLRVQIKAMVAMGKIQDDLTAIGLLLQAKRMPRLMVMVAEQNVGEEIYHSWWRTQATSVDLGVVENSLISEFQEKGFRFIDPAAALKDIKVSKAYQVDNLDDEKVKKLAAQTHADVVIYGKALAKTSVPISGTNLKSVQANISLKAVDADTGRVLATAQAQASAAHIDEVTGGTKALEAVAKKAAALLMEQILKGWSHDIAGAGEVRLSINGVGSYSELLNFLDFLRREVRGVEAIHHRSIGTDKVAEVDLEYRGDGQSLASELINKKMPGFIIKITSVTLNRVEMSLEKSGGE